MTTYTFTDTDTDQVIDVVTASSLAEAVSFAALSRNPRWICAES